MRELWKKSLFLASVGFVLGVLLGLGILALEGSLGGGEQQAGGMTLYLVSSGLLGAVNMGATVVYSMESWGLLRVTLTHFCICMASVCGVGIWIGWLSPGDPWTWIILGVCVVVYFIIWIIMYLRYKREIRKINEALERWKDAQGD